MLEECSERTACHQHEGLHCNAAGISAFCSANDTHWPPAGHQQHQELAASHKNLESCVGQVHSHHMNERVCVCVRNSSYMWKSAAS